MTAVVTKVLHLNTDTIAHAPWCPECQWSGPVTAHREAATTNATIHNRARHADADADETGTPPLI